MEDTRDFGCLAFCCSMGRWDGVVFCWYVVLKVWCLVTNEEVAIVTIGSCFVVKDRLRLC